MKKHLSIILSFALICLILIGCSNSTEQAVIGKNLDKNLKQLQSAVTSLDTIDNNYINNPDIYSMEKSTNISNTAKISAFNLLENETTTENNTNQIIQNLLENELKKRLSLNNNGKCNSCNNEYLCDSDGYRVNCGNNVICDDNGNCYYCNNTLSQNSSNSCTSCGNSYLINKTSTTSKPELINLSNDQPSENNIDTPKYEFVEEPIIDESFTILPLEDEDNEPNANVIADNDSNIEQPTSTTNNVEFDNHNITQESNTEIETVENSENNFDSNINNESENKLDNSNIKLYYFTNESFKPIKLKYNPRFITEYNESHINDQLTSYLYKVQRLYAMTEDALEANNILKITQTQLLDSIEEIRNLNSCIINGTCSPSTQQLQALNNYIYDIKTTIKRLKNCNGDLENEITTINSNVPTSIASSVDVMNSNYVKLINHLDTRITYHESALATLEQIKYLIEDAKANNNITEEEIENIIEELENNQETTENNNDVIDAEINDENITQTEDPSIETNTDTENPQNLIENNTNETLNSDEDIVSTNQDNVEVNVSEELEEDNGQESEIESDEESGFFKKNIDTYLPKTDEVIDNDVNNTLTESPNPAYDSYNPTTPENTNNSSFSNGIANEEIVDNGSTTNNTTTNELNNPTNNAIINNANNGLLNDNIYKNSVINQNNLNNNDGYGGYYYSNDGNIKNTGLDNNNEYGNNGNTIENNVNKNNNTNTYGYNTMLDIINQGTVNNGINTL